MQVNWKDVTILLQKLRRTNHQVFVAGGAALHKFLGESSPQPNDVDIFILSREGWELACTRVAQTLAQSTRRASGIRFSEANGPYADCVKIADLELGDMKVQILYVDPERYETAGRFLRCYDMDICQVAWDEVGFTMSQKFVECIRTKRVPYYPELSTTPGRMEKYRERYPMFEFYEVTLSGPDAEADKLPF